MTGMEPSFHGETIKAYKWLRWGAVDPDGGFEWGLGSARTAPAGPPTAVHGYLLKGLPYEMDDELWEVALGEVIGCQPFLHQKSEGGSHQFEYDEQSIFALRGRLVRRIDTWTPEVAEEFARECARETRWRALKGLHDATQVLEDTLPAGSALQLGAASGFSYDLPQPVGQQEGRDREAFVLSLAARLLSIWSFAREGWGSPAALAWAYASAAAVSRAAAAFTYAAAIDPRALQTAADAAGSAYADERRRQARWLREQLGLQESDAALIQDVA
ncbi:MAG: hypothetical protein ACRDHO_03975 [Actinomycetota bacterium]